MFEYSESVSPKHRPRRLQTMYMVTQMSLFFLALACALNFDSHFFGSSYKIVFNVSEFVIYPPTAEVQYLTFDSIADSIDT